MNGLVIEYRDPLFGIFTIFTLIFIVSFLTYAYNIYIEKKSRKEYRKLLKKFELGDLKEDDYIHLYTTYNLPFDSIILLASSFLHKGDYNKAISVYLALLEHVKDPTKKEELLELLGNTYFKGGFLQRSKDIYLKILKFSPHNIIALKYLLLIYEKLKDYSKTQDVIESLKELDVDIQKEEIFITTLKIIDDSLLSFEEKSIKLLEIFSANKIIERLVMEFLLKYNKKLFWKNINKFSLSKVMDLLWYLDFNDIDFNAVNNNIFLKELYSAKKHINSSTSSDIFEFNVLISTNNSTSKVDIDLNFDFICTQCKKLHPIYDNRCPHCNSILTFKVKPQLTKGYYEKNSSLQ
ncbi:MAG: tetratricopeptide repeat protein [Arcobacteraceae bacterium]|nr:tetratricopeptide repeat protein [Arcobacteraceae bacterium]